MSSENIMYIEIDQKNEFENFVRFLEREFKCDGLLKVASLIEEIPPISSTDDLKLDEPKLEPEVVQESLEEDSDQDESDSEPFLETETRRVIRCDKCQDYKTHRRSLLLKHQKNCKGGEYGCDQCGKNYKNLKNLKRHEIFTHGEFRYFCSVCDYKGTREREFRLHMSRRHGSGEPPQDKPVKDLTCELCGYQTSYKQSLKDHMDGIHLQAAFPCQQCGEVFNTVKKLRRHEKTEREGELQGLQCDKCWKTISNRRALIRHMRQVHDPNKPSLKTFVNSDNPTRRKMRHLGGRDWACMDCDYRSNKSTNVYKHIESKHVVGQDYICPHCGKVLRNLNSYDNHIYKDHRDRDKTR